MTIQLAQIVIGCEQLGGTDWGVSDRKSLEEAISRAWELGFRTFDTADVYGLGRSETRLSEILGAKRHGARIISKGGVRWKHREGRAATWRDNSPEYLALAVENSLRRLRIETIPLYFVHWPDDHTHFNQLYDTLERLTEQGKIVRYGFSNFPVRTLLQAEVRKWSAVQYPLNLLSDESEENELASFKMHKIERFGYGSLAQGLLSGRYSADTQFGESDRRHRLPHFQAHAWKKNVRILNRVREISNDVGISMAAVAIQAVRSSGLVDNVIVGIKNAEQADEIGNLSHSADASSSWEVLRNGRKAQTRSYDHPRIGNSTR